MWENIIIAAVAVVLVAFVFCFGYICGAIFEYPKPKAKRTSLRFKLFGGKKCCPSETTWH